MVFTMSEKWMCDMRNEEWDTLGENYDHDENPCPYLSRRFLDLVGKTIVRGDMRKGADKVWFETADGMLFTMFMYEDPMTEQAVWLEDVVGDMDIILNTEILKAEVVTRESQGDPASDWRYQDWTYYKLATIKGYVDMRWCGVSSYDGYSRDVLVTMHDLSVVMARPDQKEGK